MVIVASGPSTSRFKCKTLEGRARVVAIKQNVDICPFADVVYGCDSAWWRYRKGMAKFTGLRIMWEGNGLREFPEILRIKIKTKEKRPDQYSDDLQWEAGTVGAGGNSGFQVMNLVAQWGVKTIGLVGFDMSEANGRHWYGNNNWPGANNPTEGTMRRWRESFDRAAPILEKRGISVFNLSPLSALKCFPQVTFDQMMAAHDGQ